MVSKPVDELHNIDADFSQQLTEAMRQPMSQFYRLTHKYEHPFALKSPKILFNHHHHNV